MNEEEQDHELQLRIQREDADLRLRSLKVRRWLRTNEVALYLGTTRSAVKKLVLRKRLQPNKLAGRLYFDREALDALIKGSGFSLVQTNTRRD